MRTKSPNDWPENFSTQIALHVDADAVGPPRARLRHQRHLHQAVDHRLERCARVEHSRVDDHLVHGVIGVEDVSQSARMRHQLAHRQRAACVFQLRRTVLVLPDVDLQLCELGNVPRHGIVEPPLAFFVQQHHRDAGDGLGHGRDTKDRILLQWIGFLRVETTDAAVVHHFAVPLEQGDKASDLVLVDETLHSVFKAPEALGRDTNRLRRHKREIPRACGTSRGCLRWGRTRRRLA